MRNTNKATVTPINNTVIAPSPDAPVETVLTRGEVMQTALLSIVPAKVVKIKTVSNREIKAGAVKAYLVETDYSAESLSDALAVIKPIRAAHSKEWRAADKAGKTVSSANALPLDRITRLLAMRLSFATPIV